MPAACRFICKLRAIRSKQSVATRGKSVKSELAHLIVGAVGSHVKLEIEREGGLMTFDLERAIPVPEQLREKIR